MKELVTFESLDKKLTGELYKPEGEEKAALLILAGGANIPHNEGWYPTLQQSLSKKGISSVAFDFAGVGQSEGVFTETSLTTRTEDAKNALALLRQKTEAKKLYVMGVSMGAPIALSLLKHFHVDGLILLVPAAYSLEARDKKFGSEFSAEIRKGWGTSSEFEAVSQFKGRLFLAYGTQDEIVPREIYEKYSSFVSDKNNVVEFESAGHKFMRETDEVSKRARGLLESRISAFVLNQT